MIVVFFFGCVGGGGFFFFFFFCDYLAVVGYSLSSRGGL